jgi:hypothetical protein
LPLALDTKQNAPTKNDAVKNLGCITLAALHSSVTLALKLARATIVRLDSRLTPDNPSYSIL